MAISTNFARLRLQPPIASRFMDRLAMPGGRHGRHGANPASGTGRAGQADQRLVGTKDTTVRSLGALHGRRGLAAVQSLGAQDLHGYTIELFEGKTIKHLAAEITDTRILWGKLDALTTQH